MRVELVGGPMACEEVEVSETVWQKGILHCTERVKPALSGDAFVEPRVGTYIRRRFSAHGVKRYAWQWNGWQR